MLYQIEYCTINVRFPLKDDRSIYAMNYKLWCIQICIVLDGDDFLQHMAFLFFGTFLKMQIFNLLSIDHQEKAN